MKSFLQSVAVSCIVLLLVSHCQPAFGFTSPSSIPSATTTTATKTHQSAITPTKTSVTARKSPLFCNSHQNNLDDDKSTQRQKWHQRVRKAICKHQLDTLEPAGLEDARTAGIRSNLKKVTKLHNPKTYLALAAVMLYRYSWCFKSPYYWFAVGFLIKWYRARYVFKIPVWDRQPNWNNIITSPEQEKDLKAYTCKTCGSTIFIAKTREFFFEGNTGIGGLGCFSCGAKGKDNFVMDRDRIVEDVADMDDYFDYERPLDFVSRAERRSILKEAGGDEEKANQMLVERSNASSDTLIDKPEKEPIDVVVEKDGEDDDENDESVAADDEESSSEVVDATIEDDEPTEETPPPQASNEENQKPKKKKKKEQPKKPADDDDLDALGLDDF